MTTQESKQQYEGAILNQLIKNSERLVIVERDIEEIKTQLKTIGKTTETIQSLLGWLKWIGGSVVAIALSLIANFVYTLVT